MDQSRNIRLQQMTARLADSKMSSDIGSASDDEFVSSASTASAQEDPRNPTALPPHGPDMRQSAPSNSFAKRGPYTDGPHGGRYLAANLKRPLHLLDLPMDILKDIIKEVGVALSSSEALLTLCEQVTHTNDLTSLALTCSAFHALAIPHMYSRFDIVWPDTISSSDHPAGVDALSYGLATLVMGEGMFLELPTRDRLSPCPQCGCDGQHSPPRELPPPSDNRRMRRGNHYAQYTRKFSVGSGPLIWVQEYAVTKETGKMLGTLVAVAVARMVNLESFTWDMPTGVLRDVWIALASLADRPGHECRLEKVWVRWHDNSEQLQGVPGAPAAVSLPLPGALQGTHGGAPQSINTPPLLQKYGHVEYPTLSILPPLKNLSVLDIDEPSYLEEMAVLINRSRDRLKELRIGISHKASKASWLKPVGSGSSSQQNTTANSPAGWPKVGGVLSILACKSASSSSHTTAAEPSLEPEVISQTGGNNDSAQQVSAPTPSAGDTAHDDNDVQGSPPSEALEIVSSEKEPAAGIATSQKTEQQVSAENKPSPHYSSKSSESCSTVSVSDTERSHRKLKLEVLELERVHISTQVMLQVLDWTRITHLTILRCEDHEKLWKSLRRHFTPSKVSRSSPKMLKSKQEKEKSSQSDFPLRIKHLHTDTVSHSLLQFVKDAICPNTLETLILQDAPLYDSIVMVDAIYRGMIRKHRTSLRKLLVDSSDRSSTTSMAEIHTPRWRRWMFNREMISCITSGRMSQLREVGLAMHSKDWVSLPPQAAFHTNNVPALLPATIAVYSSSSCSLYTACRAPSPSGSEGAGSSDPGHCQHTTRSRAELHRHPVEVLRGPGKKSGRQRRGS